MPPRRFARRATAGRARAWDVEEHQARGLLAETGRGGLGGLLVPADLLGAEPVVALEAVRGLTAGVRLGGVAAGVEQPDREGRGDAAGSAHQDLRVGVTGDAGHGRGVEVVPVLAHEVEDAGLRHDGAVLLHRVLVVVAEGDGPLDAARLHRGHDVVDGLLDLEVGPGRSVDHVAVDEGEVGPLPVQDLAHELDGAAVDVRAALGVVELHDPHAAGRAKGERHGRARGVPAAGTARMSGTGVCGGGGDAAGRCQRASGEQAAAPDTRGGVGGRLGVRGEGLLGHDGPSWSAATRGSRRRRRR